jgi:serine/threonine protein kinase
MEIFGRSDYRRNLSVEGDSEMLGAFARTFEGRVIDSRYHLKRYIGAGSYGMVYSADERVAGKVILEDIAIKIIPPADLGRDRQLRLSLSGAKQIRIYREQHAYHLNEG